MVREQWGPLEEWVVEDHERVCDERRKREW